MSRVTRRAGTKALVCMECQRNVKGTQAKIRTSFRGQSRVRLDRHIRDVHRNPRNSARPQ